MRAQPRPEADGGPAPAAAAPAAGAASVPALRYPPASRGDVADRVGGLVVPDPYRWLEDADDPRTVSWSAAQESLGAAWFASLPDRDRIGAALRPLLRPGSVGVPRWAGGRAFVARHRPGADHPAVWCHEPDADHPAVWWHEPDTAARVALDLAALDPSGRTALSAWTPSPDGRRLAVQLSGGDETTRLVVLDVDRDERVGGPWPSARPGPLAWASDWAWYRVCAEPDRPVRRRVVRHALGEAGGEPVRGGPPDGAVATGVDVAGRWLLVTARIGDGDGVWAADLDAGDPCADELLVPLVEPVAGGRVVATARPDGTVELRTTRGAPRGRLCTVDPAAPHGVREVVAEDPEAVLHDAVRLAHGPHGRPALVVARARHAVAEVTVHDAQNGALVDEVALPGLGSVVGLSTAGGASGGPADVAWIGWTDFTTPPCVLAYRSGTGRAQVVERAPTPTDAPPAGRRATRTDTPPAARRATPTGGPRVHARQVRYRSADGTPVRMFLLVPASRAVAARPPHPPHQRIASPGWGRRRGRGPGAPATHGSGARPTAPAPALLTAYGGFGLSSAPVYSAGALAWVAAGGIWALAAVRGGGEEGAAWHAAGRRAAKQRSIDDLHAAGDHLVAEGWTDRERLALLGTSNGGLLAAAALTQRPDAYRAAVFAAAPLDMVRFSHLGAGAVWTGEYGDPADPAELPALLRYSPYHRVEPGCRYPATLITALADDVRVDPAHARKLTAALQHATAGGADRPVLLRVERDVGHGATAASRLVERAVDQIAFLAHATGLDVIPP